MADYRETAPAGPVGDLLECAWRAAVPGTAGRHQQRVLPDGCMDLLLLGADARSAGDSLGGRLVVAGPDTAAHLASSAPGSVTTGLRFRPGALPALLGAPADALRDRRTDLADVLGRAAAMLPVVDGYTSAPRRSGNDRGIPLGDRAAGDPALRRLLEVVRALRAAGEGRRTQPEPLPRPALRALARGMPAAELADRLGVTSRTLHRRCVATLGYGPSVARRVLRFRAATGLLFDGVAPAEVAARTGYADQPHLSREVRELAGVSPTALTARTEASRTQANRNQANQAQANRSSEEPSGSRTVA
ncbi:helix-turn-helix domain-containing protein [Pseudonocardia nantongensis]|uniref:helix-turn-helix domain-containing protein n=1 Tax=Pseudonocardia nantongensis TaxID=1181885 RepID=UPI0039793690